MATQAQLQASVNAAYMAIQNTPLSQLTQAQLDQYAALQQQTGITGPSVAKYQTYVTKNAPATTASAAPTSTTTTSAPVVSTTTASSAPTTSTTTATPVAPTNTAATTQSNQNTLNSAYQAIQLASSNGTLTQAMLDNYTNMASQFGLPAVSVALYQNQVNKQTATQQAQANFALPQGNDNTTTTQTTTDPSGNTYTYVPADPTTGTAGQWYKSSGNGMVAVGANGQPVANAPVIPTQTFQQQLNTTQTDVGNYAQQQAQTAAVNAFKASPEEQAYQQAVTAYQNAAAATNPDPAQLQQLAGAVNTASQAVQAKYGSDQYNAGTVQQQSGQAGNFVQAANNAASAAQEAAALAASQQQAAAAQAATDKSAMSVLQQDIKTLGPASASLLGTYNTPQDAITNAQNAYNTALAAYQNNKSSDPAVISQLANNLQTAAELNRTVTGDLAVNYSAANQNAAAAQAGLGVASQALQAANAAQSQATYAQLAQQAAQSANANNPLGALGDFISKNIGWDTLATVGGSLIGGPLGAAIGRAVAGAAQGESIGQIVKGAVTSYALSNGIQAVSDALQPAVTTAQTGIAEGTVTPSPEPVAPEAPTPAEATPVAPSTAPIEETALPPAAEAAAPVAPTAAAEAPAPAPTPTAAEAAAPVAPTPAAATNTVPVTLPDGSVGTYNLATGETLDAAGAPASVAPVAPTAGPGVQVASTEPGAGVAEAAQANQPTLQQQLGKVATDNLNGTITDAQANEQINGIVNNAISNGQLTDVGNGVYQDNLGNQLSMNAQTGTYDVVNTGVAGGAGTSLSPVAPVGEVAGAAAIAPEAAAPVAASTATVAPEAAAVAPEATVAPEAVAPTTIEAPTPGITETVTPGTGTNPVASVDLTPAAPEVVAPAAISPETAAIVGGGALAAGAAGAGAGTGAVASPVAATPTPTPTPEPVAPTATTPAPTETPVTTAPTTEPVAPTTTPTTAPAPDQAPLSPVEQTVIPADTSAVAPVEAAAPAATSGLPSWALPALAGAAAGALLSGTGSAGGANYNTGSYPVGKGIPVINPGANPGLLMGPDVVKPQLTAMGTQANYYWGGRPLIQNPADVNNWNTQIPANAQGWGAINAQGVGANSLNINSLINDTLGLGHALSAYPGAVAPTPIAPNTTNAYINSLVNAALTQGAAAAGGPVAPTK